MEETMKTLDYNEAENLWLKLKEKDPFTAEHTRRVSKMAEKFARELSWKEKDVDELKLAALIHDLGKIEISDDTYDKIRSGEKLTPDELKSVKDHAGHTRQIDHYEHIPSMVIEILNYHHERFDGSGYPYGIKGDNIPECVRILSIADYYDTVMVQRPWKIPEKQKPLNQNDVIKILIDETLRRFDPELVPKFINFVVAESKELNEREIPL
jgi:HD-GYP domain-containing protein (c-di-GMP phosphodiesterase class II)